MYLYSRIRRPSYGLISHHFLREIFDGAHSIRCTFLSLPHPSFTPIPHLVPPQRAFFTFSGTLKMR